MHSNIYLEEEQDGNSQVKDFNPFAASSKNKNASKDTWYMDLGATQHMAHNTDWFITLDDNKSHGLNFVLGDGTW